MAFPGRELIRMLVCGWGVFTANETRRVREKYNIEGDFGNDLANGLFCPCCSVIRNELEIRRRENAHELGYVPPAGFIEDQYHSPPPMTTLLEPLPVQPHDTRTTTLPGQTAPAKHESHDSRVPIPSAAVLSSRDGNLLPTITERVAQEAAAASPQPKGKGKVKIMPFKIKNAAKKGRDAIDIPEVPEMSDKEARRHSAALKTALENLKQDQQKHAEVLAAVRKELDQDKRAVQAAVKPVLPDLTKAKPADAAAIQPAASQPLGDHHPESDDQGFPTTPTKHSLEQDKKVQSMGLAPASVHSLNRDALVQSPRTPTRLHELIEDTQVPLSPKTAVIHDLKHDGQVRSEIRPATPHNLRKDEQLNLKGVEPAALHALKQDDQIPSILKPAIAHDLRKDEKVPQALQDLKEHALSADKQVASAAMANLVHSLEQDKRVDQHLEGFGHNHGASQDSETDQHTPPGAYPKSPEPPTGILAAKPNSPPPGARSPPKPGRENATVPDSLSQAAEEIQKKAGGVLQQARDKLAAFASGN